MALTKPKLSTNINTDSSVFTDPILVLHQGSSAADVDVGFLMNRSNGLTANAAVIWQESSKSFVHILTNSSGAPDANLNVQSYANVSVGNVLLINNAGIYVDGTLGTAGQVLASDGSKTFWAPPGGFTGGVVSGATVFQSNLVVSNTTTSVSTVTGALVVRGGAGIAGNVYSNAVYTATGVYWSGNGQAFTSTTIANTAEITANLSSGQNVGLSLTATGVVAGNYGSATSIPTIVVDSKGRITSVTSNAVSTTITLAGGSGSGSVAGGGTLTVAGTTNQITTSVSSSTITIALAQDVTAPGNLTVTGNLVVQGNTTTLNTETLTIEDLNITVANGAINAAAADGAGLTVGGANARLLYKSATDSWVFDRGVFASGNLVANSGTTSSSVTTGALVVAGGAGISGNVVAANILIPAITTTSSNVLYGLGVRRTGYTRSGSSNWEYGTIASGLDPWGSSGNAWSIDNAQGAGLFNLVAGAYHDTLTNPSGPTSTTYKYFGARGASRINLADQSVIFYRGNLANAGGQVAGDVVNFIESFRINGTDGNVVVNSNTASTSTTTGALVVSGGVGVAGNINIGGSGGNAIVTTADIYTTANIEVGDNVRWTANGQYYLLGYTTTTTAPLSGILDFGAGEASPTSMLDAFGINVGMPVYDMMDPVGQTVVTDYNA